jgi:hypothetical protein
MGQKVRGKFHYFHKWGDDPEVDAATKSGLRKTGSSPAGSLGRIATARRRAVSAITSSPRKSVTRCWRRQATVIRRVLRDLQNSRRVVRRKPAGSGRAARKRAALLEMWLAGGYNRGRSVVRLLSENQGNGADAIPGPAAHTIAGLDSCDRFAVVGVEGRRANEPLPLPPTRGSSSIQRFAYWHLRRPTSCVVATWWHRPLR